MNKNIVSALLLLTSSFANPLLADEANISIKNAWIAEAPPVSKVMVAYMTIKNNSDKAVAITKAESKLYGSIEFHESIDEDGMSRMIRYDALNVPAHGSIQLKRGGKHFMLFNPTRHLKAGDMVNIKLTTDKNASKTISITVKKAQY